MRLAHRFALLVLGLAAGVACAAEINTANGLALKGHDPVAYFIAAMPVKGLGTHRAEHRGATFVFASAANRDAFVADPLRYAPQYGGYCAFGVSRGYKADIDPAAFSVVDGKLYLNYNAAVQKDWLKDTAGHVRLADRKWPEVRGQEKVIR